MQCTNARMLSGLLLGISAAPASAQWWWPPTGGMDVEFRGGYCNTEAVITISGEWHDSCPPHFASISRDGSVIDFAAIHDPPPQNCLQVITPWELTAVTDSLLLGEYSVYATHYWQKDSQTDRVFMGTFLVAHPCDTNCDGSINQFDIQSFVDIMSHTGERCGPYAGDTNFDCTVNGFDIRGFVECLEG